MSYVLYTDKEALFECKVNVINASLKNAKARLILESSDTNIVCNGTIDSNNTCHIPIKKMVGVFNESDVGKIKLEFIVENGYFSPWESDFKIERYERIQIKEIKKSNAIAINELLNLCDLFGITTDSISNKKTMEKFTQIVNEYLFENKEFQKDSQQIIKDVIISLSYKQ